jgi:hypothetical protein
MVIGVNFVEYPLLIMWAIFDALFYCIFEGIRYFRRAGMRVDG